MKALRLQSLIIVLLGSAVSYGQNWTTELSLGYQLSIEQIEGDETRSYGYITTTAEKPSNSSILGNGLVVSASFKKNRLLLQTGITLSEWNFKYNGVDRTEYYYKVGSSGFEVERLRTRQFDYSKYLYYLEAQFGIGYNLMPNDQKLSFIPILRFNPEFLLGQKIESETVVYHYENYVLETSSTETKEDADSNAGANGKTYRTFWDRVTQVEPSLGFRLDYNFEKHVALSFTSGYQFQNLTRYWFLDWNSKNQGIFFGFSVGYKLF